MVQYLPSSYFAVPFIHPLKRGLEADRIIAVYGVIKPDADRFVINLQTGPNSGDDVALHISYRIPEKRVVFNTLRNGHWETEEIVHQVPAHRGQHFQMLINIRPSKFKVAINGQHFAAFEHRMPASSVSHVGVNGDVDINTVTGVKTAHKPDRVIYNPEVPLQQNIQDIKGIFPGRLIRVRGSIPHDSYRFSFNLMHGHNSNSNNIPFHVSVRPNAQEFLVEVNSQLHGNWERGIQIRPCPVQRGHSFEMLILVDRDNYKVAFNGQHFCEFEHRHPISHVDHFRVVGDVRINKVSFEGRPVDCFGFTPIAAPVDNYYHENAYEALSNYHVFANPYPIF